jgi:hypothetical protein
VQPYQVWDWGGKDFPLGSVPYEQVSALDIVPNEPVQVSQAQSGSAGTGFGDNYQLFLNFLNPSPDQSDPTYQQYQQQLTDDSRKLFNLQQDAQIAYRNFADSSKSTESYQDWLTNEGSTFGSRITMAQSRVQGDMDELTEYSKHLKGPVAAAIQRYVQGLLQIRSQSGNPVTVAPWYTGQTPYEHVMEITGNNFGGNATHGSSNSFTINQSTETYQNQEVWSTAGATFLDWFGIELGGRFDQIDTSLFASDYTVSFNFQDLAAITVTPGSWYNGAMPTNYWKGPFFPGYSGFQSGGSVYYFGRGGSLARQYTALVVGYRPTIELNAGNSFAQYLKDHISSESVVWIGPFAFEGSGGSDATRGKIEINGARITAKGQGDWPYVVAKVSNWTVPPRPSAMAGKAAATTSGARRRR